jgi:hypothetical protein
MGHTGKRYRRDETPAAVNNAIANTIDARLYELPIDS